MRRPIVKKSQVEGYRVFLKDTEALKIRKAYDRLKHKLSLKQQRMNHEALIQALDSAADDYLLACDLYLIARDNFDKFILRFEIEMSKLTIEAQRALERKKKAKLITSQITESLKRGWIFQNHEEKVKGLEDERREREIVKRRMESLKEAWKQRMSSLQSQARSVEQSRIIKLGRSNEEKEN